MRYLYLLIILLMGNEISAQDGVEIEEVTSTNRIGFYALNKTHKDYDVLFTIKGTGFRQGRDVSRPIRVPSATKVHLKTIILLRGQEPTYTYQIEVNDSLSPRALRKEYEAIQIPPKKIEPSRPITLYVSDNCPTCDSIVSELVRKNYIFRSYNLTQNTQIREQLNKSLGSRSVSGDSLSSPIVNLGGRIYMGIESYTDLMEELEK